MTTAAPALRPMTVADLVDEIFRLYRRNFGLLFGVSAVVWVPTAIVYLALLLMFFAGAIPQNFSPAQVFQYLFVLAIAGIVGLVGLPVLFGGLTAAVSDRYLERPATVDGAVRRGLRCYLRLVGAYVLLFLLLIALFLVPLGLVAVLAVAGAGVVGALLGIVAFVAMLVGLVWITATFAFIGQAIVIEDTGVLRSFGRSRALAAGSRWRILGINLLLSLIGSVLFSIPSSLASAVLNQLPFGASLSQLVAVLAQAAYYPVQLGTLTLLYYDLRVRKEAFDLTLAAERLPS